MTMDITPNAKSSCNVAAFKYADNVAPAGYRCGGCGVAGCKLWRRYSTFLEHNDLRCCDCAGAKQMEDVTDIDADGCHYVAGSVHRTDSIGWRVPAVPTEEGDTYWGYTSVPDDGVRWWKALPTRVQKPELKVETWSRPFSISALDLEPRLECLDCKSEFRVDPNGTTINPCDCGNCRLRD